MIDPWQRIHAKKALDAESREMLAALYGSRGKKAMDAVDGGLVKKYRDFFVVAGSSGNHVVSEGVCTCRDFAFRQKPCAHILAVRIAEETGAYTAINAWYQETWKG